MLLCLYVIDGMVANNMLQDQELKKLEQKLLWERTRAYPAIIRPQPDSFVVGDYKLELLKVSSVKRNKLAKNLADLLHFQGIDRTVDEESKRNLLKNFLGQLGSVLRLNEDTKRELEDLAGIHLRGEIDRVNETWQRVKKRRLRNGCNIKGVTDLTEEQQKCLDNADDAVSDLAFAAYRVTRNGNCQ